MIWTFNGHIRIHFNKKEEAPLFASITNREHTWEVLARELYIDGAALTSSSDPDARPGIDPFWWLEGLAHVEVHDNGRCFIYKFRQETAQVAGLMSGIAMDMTNNPGPALVLEGLSGWIPSTKKRKTRKKTSRRRVR